MTPAALGTIERRAPSVLSLTPREREVLELVAQSLSNPEIAEALTVKRTTVKTHVQRILAKLGASNRIGVVIAAYEWGLISPGNHRTLPPEVFILARRRRTMVRSSDAVAPSTPLCRHGCRRRDAPRRLRVG